jgi:hypothetical protein
MDSSVSFVDMWNESSCVRLRVVDHQVDVFVVVVAQRESIDGVLQLLKLVVVRRAAFIIILVI